MTSSPASALGLTLRHPDRYADVREAAAGHAADHGCGLAQLTAVDAREVAVLVRATHSSYVLESATGIGYRALHIADASGRTGRLDSVEPDGAHVELAAANVRRHAMEERVRIHHGKAVEVFAALNGPYDLLVLDPPTIAAPALYDEFVRLVRVGGSLFAKDVSGESLSPDFLARLGSDDRLLASFATGLGQVLATRTR